MKKIKLLTPILGLTALSGSLIPLTSCGSTSKEETLKVVPSELLNIKDGRLYGLKDEADTSKYDTISIPSDVQYIEANAFSTDRTYSTITTLIVDANIRHIGKNAFAGLKYLKTIDLTAWTADTVDFLTAETLIVGNSASERYVRVKLSSDLNKAKRQKLIDTLVAAGVPEAWFYEPTEGHVTIAEEQKEAIARGTAAASMKFNLIETPDENETIDIILERTGGSTGTLVQKVSAKVTTTTSNATNDSQSILTLKARMNAEVGHQLVEGETVEFKAIVMCEDTTKSPSTQWIQEVTGFKLTYAASTAKSVESLSMNPTLFVCVGSTLTPSVTVIPADAENQECDITVSDPTVATVEDGVITGVKAGECTVTATSKDTGVSTTSNLTVVEPTSYEELKTYFNIGVYKPKGTLSAVSPYLYISGRTSTPLPETLILPSTIKYNDVDCPFYLYNPSKTQTVLGIFTGETALKNIVLPNTITSITNYMFSGCTALENVYIPDDAYVTYIGYRAFYGCESLEEMYVPDSVTDISYYAFFDSGIKTTNDADNHVWYYRLNGNDHYLANTFSVAKDSGEFEIKFHEDTAAIADGFFWGYDPETKTSHNGKDIKITKINFEDCKQLTKICPYAFSYGSTYISDEGSIPFIITAEEITFPSTLKYIGDNAFMNPWDGTISPTAWLENDVKTINLNEGLEYIGFGAFYGWYNVESLTIPSTVESIGYVIETGGLKSVEILSEFDETEYGSFQYCEKLSQLTFAVDEEGKSKLEEIGTNAFYGTLIKSTKQNPVVLPSSLKRLGGGSLAFITCDYDTEEEVPNIEYIQIPASVEFMYAPFIYDLQNAAVVEGYTLAWAFTDDGELEFEDKENTWRGGYTRTYAPDTEVAEVALYDRDAWTMALLEANIFGYESKWSYLGWFNNKDLAE